MRIRPVEVTIRGTASGVRLRRAPAPKAPAKARAATTSQTRPKPLAFMPSTLRCHGVRTASDTAVVTPRPLHSRPTMPMIVADRRLRWAVSMASWTSSAAAPVRPSPSMMSALTVESPDETKPTTAIATRISGNRATKNWTVAAEAVEPPLVSPTRSWTASRVPNHGHRSPSAFSRSTAARYPGGGGAPL
jgi:hypothetical protein